jgi:HSP20 family protein
MARDDDRQYQMPARQQEPGRLTRSSYGGGGNADWWSASPFQMLRRMQDEMDRTFGSFFGQPWGGGGAQGIANWSPSVDVYETDKEIVVKAEVPGVEPEDIEVYCTEDALVLRGESRREDERQEGGTHRIERRYGRFERQIPLPPGAIPDQAQANFRNGVLELRIPKSEEARQRMRRIPVGGAAGSKGGEAGSKGGQAGSPSTAGTQAQSSQEQGSSAKPKGSKK